MSQYKEFIEIIDDLLKDENVRKMKKYRQHCDVSTYEHCKNVAYINYIICKKLKFDYVSAARAGMLHDLFLYDWREKRPTQKFTDKHAFKHPKTALENAKKITKINKIEEDIILNHMWPVTIKLPKYKESYIITISDKYCAIAETFGYIKRKSAKKMIKIKERVFLLLSKKDYEM